MQNFHFSRPTYLTRRMRGTLLLALPLCGLAFYSPAQAQVPPALPKLAPPTNAGPLLPLPEDEGAVNRVMALSRYESICKTPIDLELKDATLPDVIKAVQSKFPEQKIGINVRDANSLRVSFLVKQRRVGDVLQAAAALCDCDLYIFEGGLLIAQPTALLGEQERAAKQGKGGLWRKSAAFGDSGGWSSFKVGKSIIAQAVAREVADGNFKPDDKGVINTTFSKFRPETQVMLQQLGTWAREIREDSRNINPIPFVLKPDSPIKMDTSDPNLLNVDFGRDTSKAEVGAANMKIVLPLNGAQSAGYTTYIRAK